MGNKKTQKKSYDAAFNKAPTRAAVLPEESAKRTKKIIIIFVSAFLSAVLLLGIILGTVAIARNASYAVKLESVGMTEGVVNYFVTEFKAEYIKTLNQSGTLVTDNEAFWATPYLGGNVSTSTKGDYLKLYVENSIKSLISANLIFDKYSKLSKDDKNNIAIAVNEILTYRAGGSKEQFDANVEQYGFDYKDFKKGIEMLYKANVVASRVFGSDGANVRSFPEFCDEFFMGSDKLSGYTRAKIVFVRTQDTFVYNDKGEREKDEKGNDKLRDLTADERAEREGYIQLLESCIKGYEDGSVSKELFDEVAEKVYKYKDNLTEEYIDYYLCAGSSFTEEFGKEFPDVIEKALSLKVGEVDALEYGSTMADDDAEGNSFVGRVYIYKVATDEGAYKRTDKVGFFEDFNVLCASALYSRMLSESTVDVELRKKWEKIDIINHKYTNDYGV